MSDHENNEPDGQHLVGNGLTVPTNSESSSQHLTDDSHNESDHSNIHEVARQSILHSIGQEQEEPDYYRELFGPSPPASPSSSSSPALSDSSSNFEDPSIFIDLPKDMDTYAKLTAEHFPKMRQLLAAKADELKFYVETSNYSTMHLDWPAGNPDDPTVAGASSTDAKGKSADNDIDRDNYEKIARMIARFSFGAEGGQVSPKHQFTKTNFYGDWLASSGGEKEFFIEIQVKRVQGSDKELLDACGINHSVVFLPLRDLIIDDNGGVALVDPENGIAAIDLALQNAAKEKRARETKAAGKRVASGSSSVTTTSTVAVSSNDSSSVESSMTLAPSTAASTIAAPPGFAHRDTTHADLSTGLFPVTRGPLTGGLALTSTRHNFRRELMKRFERLDAQVPAGKDWPELVAQSSIYMVKVFAFPRPKGGIVHNAFTGPAIRDRFCTLLGMGGWVVPPAEVRAAYRAANPRPSSSSVAAPRPEGGFMGTKPSVQRAMPSKPDNSDVAPASAMGEFAPLWLELADPTLEDVYWMTWQLFGGRQFVGFRCGTGFGLYRKSPEVTAVLSDCPFSSPSPEAIAHSATLEGRSAK